MKRRLVAAVWIVAGGVALLYAKTLWEGRTELRAGEAALAAGDAEEAVVHFDRAAHWYSPGNPYVRSALDRLWRIVRESASGNPELALEAAEAIRGAVLGTRGFFLPHAEDLPKANDVIARLRAETRARTEPGIDVEAERRDQEALLTRDERPKTGWLVVVHAGFLGWLGAFALFVRRGFDREGRMNVRRALPWFAVAMAAFVLFAWGLLRA